MTKSLGLSVLLTTTLGFAASAYAEDPLEGHYKCYGYDPIENKKYEDTKLTVNKHDDYYHLQWQFQDGSQYEGRGLLNEDEEVLSTIFKESHDPQKQNTSETAYGLQVYELDNEEPQFEGKWLIFNQKQVGYERCYKVNEHNTNNDNHNTGQANNDDNSHEDDNHDNDDDHDNHDQNNNNNNHDEKNGED